MTGAGRAHRHARILAAVLTGPERIEVREVPRPPCPEGGLLLKVTACGVCGSDVRAYRGRKQIQERHAIADQVLPGHIIGHEIAGVIEGVGSGVTRFRLGDLVAVAPSLTCGTCDACRRGQSTVCRNYQALGWQHPGGFAEYVAVPARLLADESVNRIPEGLLAWKACLAEPLACAIHAQDALQIGPGDSVLILWSLPASHCPARPMHSSLSSRDHGFIRRWSSNHSNFLRSVSTLGGDIPKTPTPDCPPAGRSWFGRWIK